jgi:branched-chain amino acid transport system ATP-binding protein
VKNMSLLKVDQIHVAYDEVRVLNGLSLRVEEGEIVCLVGANGAGKTTTVRTIAGFLHPFKGAVTFMDQHINQLPPSKITEIGISHIPEGRRLFSSMTVRENLMMGSYLPEPRKKRKETMEWIIELFPILGERSNQIAGTLSGGEQQMLAVGRGLMSLPKLLILDEPSLGLAPTLVHLILRTIEQINDRGTTVLLVEQNVAQSLKLSHRAYILERGQVVMEGTGKELLADPHTQKAYLGLK